MHGTYGCLVAATLVLAVHSFPAVTPVLGAARVAVLRRAAQQQFSSTYRTVRSAPDPVAGKALLDEAFERARVAGYCTKHVRETRSRSLRVGRKLLRFRQPAPSSGRTSPSHGGSPRSKREVSCAVHGYHKYDRPALSRFVSKDAAACQQKCQQEKRCFTFTWRRGAHTCELRTSNAGQFRFNPRYTSGPKNCPKERIPKDVSCAVHGYHKHDRPALSRFVSEDAATCQQMCLQEKRCFTFTWQRRGPMHIHAN